MKKQVKGIIIIILSLLLLLSCVYMCIYSKDDTTHYLSIYSSYLGIDKHETYPTAYTFEAVEQGTLECVEYSINVKGEYITKKAMVYLPYGYNSNNKYDVIYLVHGRGGKYNTWLGTKNYPSEFKNILDNMILNKDTRPFILVTPGLTYQYGDKSYKVKDESSDYAVIMGTADEICGTLIPLIDSQYSTYANRNHRLIAGFSMGGSTTWDILLDHTEDFYFYIPMSMALYFDSKGYSESKSLQSAKIIDANLKNKGYSANDFKVYVATGDEDHKGVAAYMMVNDLIEYSSLFNQADANFTKGNIYQSVWKGRWHTYKQSYPYLYNGLRIFYKPIH